MVGASKPEEADEAVRGLAGLIVLGNAWKSVDVFHALNVALQRNCLGFGRGRDGGRNSLAYFAWLRCIELVDSGQGSFLPDAPKGESLKALLYQPGFVKAEVLLDPAFRQLRAEADAWHIEAYRAAKQQQSQVEVGSVATAGAYHISRHLQYPITVLPFQWFLGRSDSFARYYSTYPE